MRKSRVLLSVLALGALGVATRAAAQETTVADQGRGQFQQYCSGCHGLEGKGDGAFAAYLKAPPPDLTTIAKRRGGTFPETEVAQIIEEERLRTAAGITIWSALRRRRAGRRRRRLRPAARSRCQAYLRSIQQVARNGRRRAHLRAAGPEEG
jgi:hypothetical protein